MQVPIIIFPLTVAKSTLKLLMDDPSFASQQLHLSSGHEGIIP
jgi:hypothetical protein